MSGGQQRGEPSRVRPFLPDEPVPAGADPAAAVVGSTATADGSAAAVAGAAVEKQRPSDVSPLRPYLLTGGRTRPAAAPLELEAQVVTTETGYIAINTLTYEYRDILELCQTAHAVAEVAAQLKLHLGVARILVVDLLVLGHVTTRRPDVQPHRNVQIIERVIRGLQAID
jgi:hypothetical protein